MISINSFFSDTLNTVDAVTTNFVNSTYVNFVSANSHLITLLFTVYVMMLGYRFFSHTHHADLNLISKHLIVMSCVYAMVMNWNLYNLFVYNIFTNEPGNVAQILVNSSGGLPAGTSIASALDKIYEAIINATSGFFGQISFSTSGLAFILYGILVFLIGTALCVVALLLFIYAKMMMAVALALGPLFILFFLWECTRAIFGAWLRTLITLAFIPIVTSAILVLMLSVINVTLPSISQPPQDLQFYGIAPFLTLSLATTLLLSQVFRICSALGGGITLASLSAGVGLASDALYHSGVTPVTKKAIHWSQRKTNKAHRFRNESP